MLSELNAAMAKMQDEEADYAHDLYDEYVRQIGVNAFLNAEEAAWLSGHGAIRVGYLDQYLPFCSAKEDGTLTGALKNCLDLAAHSIKNAQLAFEAVPFATQDEALAALRKGELDCIFPVCLNLSEAEDLGLLVTSPLMETELYAAIRKSDHQGISALRRMTAALNDGSPRFDSFLMDNYPEWNTVHCSSMEECFRRTASGETDCVLLSNYRLAQTENLRDRYKLSAFTTGSAVRYSFGVNRGDGELYYILNRGVGLVSRTSVDAALLEYSYPDDRFSLTEFLEDHAGLVVLLTLAAAVCVVGLLNRRSSRQKKRLEERIAAQNRLLEQERKRHQADTMITAMAADYNSVFYVDLDTDESICYRSNGGTDAREGETYSHMTRARESARRFVAEQEQEEFLRFLDPENIREGLEHERMIAHRFRTIRNGEERYELLRIAGVHASDGQERQRFRDVGLGFSDVDRETRESIAQQHALSNALVAAREANQAKSAFLSNMSHEIRTPSTPFWA